MASNADSNKNSQTNVSRRFAADSTASIASTAASASATTTAPPAFAALPRKISALALSGNGGSANTTTTTTTSTTSTSISTPTHTRALPQTPDDAGAELTAQLEDLINTFSNKFAGVSSEIFAKMDEMSRRLDNLETQLVTSKDGGNSNKPAGSS